MAKEIKATLRARVYAQEQGRRADAAEAKAADAEQRESNLAVKLDPGERRTSALRAGCRHRRRAWSSWTPSR